jgi:flavin reductase (DIM6/NTAB) family NADH-FMN oxidoreductase RutF
MKQLLRLLLLPFFPALVFAQADEKYLVGGVPEEDGRVVFSKDITAPSLSQSQLFDTLLKWADKRFDKEKNRVVYENKEKGDIAALGEDYLVFTDNALSLDRALMSYQMIIKCNGNTCNLALQNIRYEYNVSYKREPERYTAEEWISDKNALSKGKLMRLNGKFRIATIDYAVNLMDEVEALLAKVTMIQSVTPQQATAPVLPAASENIISQSGTLSSLQGYKQVSPDKIPGNIIKMVSEDWMLITVGDDAAFNMMTASWGGLGHLLSKPVAFCFINPARYTYQLMEKNDTYTLSFYTEASREALQYCGSASGRDTDKVKGSGLTPITTPEGNKAFSEAWMIIECRKLISQPLSTEVVNDEKIRNEWLGKPMHKMYIGEITHVWIK